MFSLFSLKRSTMYGALLCVALVLFTAGAKADTLALSKAINAAENGTYIRQDSAIANKIVRSVFLQQQGNNASLADYQQFITENPDWPGLNTLRLRAEEKLATADTSTILNWFAANKPITADATVRYAKTLIAYGQNNDAQAAIQNYIETGNVTASGITLLQNNFSSSLNNAAIYKRVDKLIWDKKYDEAEHFIGVMPTNYAALIRARLALARSNKNAQNLLASVPGDLQNDSGLLFQRLEWRRKNDDTAGALAILAREPNEPLNEEAWAKERAVQVRDLMEQGQYKEAYRLARDHNYTTGAALANSEWLAGWIALRFLQQPDNAITHFSILFEKTQTPISKSRAAYWLARSYQSLGQYDTANQWLNAAAQYPTSFYGQQSAKALGLNPRDFLPAEPAPSSSVRSAYTNRDVVQAARLLKQSGMDDRAETFIRHLVQRAETGDDFVLLAELTTALNMPKMTVSVGKQAVQKNIILPVSGYPLLARGTLPRDTELDPAIIHALIRQESSFDQTATSRAGALGLMQLMPATAKMVANKIGVSHTTDKLVEDPEHNIRLGSHYFAQRLERWNGSLILAIASYNAGSGRVDEWVEKYGDPRQSRLNIIDWIETIPFQETRNYVQRVMENIEIYKMRLGENS